MIRRHFCPRDLCARLVSSAVNFYTKGHKEEAQSSQVCNSVLSGLIFTERRTKV